MHAMRESARDGARHLATQQPLRANPAATHMAGAMVTVRLTGALGACGPSPITATVLLLPSEAQHCVSPPHPARPPIAEDTMLLPATARAPELAALIAARRNALTVDSSCFDAAIDRVLAGMEKKGLVR